MTHFTKIRKAVSNLSLLLFPATFYYLSPIISLRGAAEGIITGSLIVFGILLISAIFLGRSFCSWVCPAGALQDQAAQSRTARVAVKYISWLKYIVWGSWFFFILFLILKAGGVIDIIPGFDTVMGLSTTSAPALIAYLIVVLTFFILSLIFGRRVSCHTLCWIAPFMVIGRKLGISLQVPSLRLKTEAERCTSCSRCTSICPMSLDVETLIQKGSITDNSCILCGQCKEICHARVFSWGWK